MNRVRWAVLAVGSATAVAVGACTGPTVINSGDPAPASQAPPASSSTTTPSNTHLVNGFDYAVQDGEATGYFFTSPSGRWQCAIKPRLEAGCQNATAPASAIRVAGAPDEVPGPDGEAERPNAIRVNRTGAPEFAVVPSTVYGLDPDPAKVLPFNRILAVAGFRCNVQEATGISCLSETSGAGFTFSSDEFSMHYVDVPADAP